MTRRVVITGLGTTTSLGCTVAEFWRSIREGRSGIGPIRSFDTSGFKVTFAGEVHDFPVDQFIEARQARRLDRFTQFALVAAMQAVSDSGINFSDEEPFRCGVIVGSGIGGLNEIETQHLRLLEMGPSKVSAFMIPKLMVNAASGHISIQFGLRGPNSAVATACASASNAIGDAFKIIQRDDADVMITGGSEAAITPMGLSGFAAMRALSSRNDDPQRASRPFDADRDGFVLSEGAGILVLEELEHARSRDAQIYAELLGYGMSADGSHITAPCPEGTGAAKAMSLALKDARLDPSRIDYINAHGTSTPLGDQAETAAVKTVFTAHAKSLAVSSTKSSMGHLLGASGAVELIATVLAVRDRVVPPTINYETPDPACDLDYVPNTAREMPVRFAMSNSFGFGGHNASLVVGQLDASR
jgi:3-oxoacyl-[acyl-carrier-protein] synthase II